MDNRTAFWFAFIIVAILAIDGLVYDWHLTIFLGRMLVSVSDKIAFWRDL